MNRFLIVVLAALALLLPASPARATWVVILADSETGEIGVGQATCVSGIDLRGLSGVVVTERGAATVQAFVDTSGTARTTIRDELLAGTAPQSILSVLDAVDPQHETHQYCIVDTQGRAATYTGTVAQGSQFAGGQTGRVGTIEYCVAGNLLTGAPVVNEAVSAVVNGSGTMADRLLSAMLAARAMGGDGRCSCSPGNPTGCGSPPASFTHSAIVGYLVIARSGDTASCASCGGGDYYVDLDFPFQSGSDPDPVLQMQSSYGGVRSALKFRPDAVSSLVSLTPGFLPPDGTTVSQLQVQLRDLNGQPIGVPIGSFDVVHDAESDAVSTIGTPVDDGGGDYTTPVTAGPVAGVDRLRITVDDGIRPVTLMPSARLPVGVPGEVENVGWSDRATLVWDASLAAVSYHVYRDDLALLDCNFFGSCADGLDGDLTDLAFPDGAPPVPGSGRFYLVTSEDAGGTEGVLGFSECGLRAQPAPCP